MNDQGIGASVRRKEDFRFLTGAGNYTDDISRPGQLYAYFLRSPHAHAEIDGIDTGDASAAPGVIAVFTGADLQIGGLPCGWLVNSKDGSPMIEPPHPVLAQGRVRHVGDPVAVVIAETLDQAKDAAEIVQISVAGDRYAQLEVNALVQRVVVTNHRREAAEELASVGCS
jgi:aerobic carbon-monoxide dehydrogenase large subunit